MSGLENAFSTANWGWGVSIIAHKGNAHGGVVLPWCARFRGAVMLDALTGRGMGQRWRGLWSRLNMPPLVVLLSFSLFLSSPFHGGRRCFLFSFTETRRTINTPRTREGGRGALRVRAAGVGGRGGVLVAVGIKKAAARDGRRW